MPKHALMGYATFNPSQPLPQGSIMSDFNHTGEIWLITSPAQPEWGLVEAWVLFLATPTGPSVGLPHYILEVYFCKILCRPQVLIAIEDCILVWGLWTHELHKVGMRLMKMLTAQKYWVSPSGVGSWKMWFSAVSGLTSGTNQDHGTPPLLLMTNVPDLSATKPFQSDLDVMHINTANEPDGLTKEHFTFRSCSNLWKGNVVCELVLCLLTRKFILPVCILTGVEVGSMDSLLWP